MKTSFKQFISEFIGTFMLVFIGAGSAAVGGLTLVDISLAFGFVVIAVVYTLGNISGAHINPAVTISLLVYGAIKLRQAVMYIIAQVFGAIVAGFAILVVMGPNNGLGVTKLNNDVSALIGVIAEALGTFILVITVYGSAVGKGKTNLAGIVIGLVVSAVIFTIGPLTSASINPARSIGPALIAGDFTNLWVYIVGPIIGGIAAAIVFKILDKDKATA